MDKKEKFSFRKYKVGLVSVLVGAVFLAAGAGRVSADELSKATALSQTDPASTIEQVVQATESSSVTDFAQVASVNAMTETSVVESPTTDGAATEAVTEETASADTAVTVAASEVAEEATQAVSDVETSAASVSSEVATEVAEQAQPEAKTAEVATPQSIDSDEIITVPKAWESGYKGQGTIVAIIDSGLDVDHDVLHISDLSTAKYGSEEEIEAAKAAAGITYGKWFNDKVVFGYNYVDGNTILKEGEEASHGMHVTGIATGNPSKALGDEYIYGVAPEAQVIFLRVFSDLKSSTGPALYVRAIEDAVKLGADSINLSLGSTTGSEVNMDETLIAAIKAAQKAGVNVAIAAGNDGVFADGWAKPSAENPDYGLVGNPSTTRDVISVASYNANYTRSNVVTFVGMEDNADLNHGKSAFTNPDKSDKKFENGKAYDYVYVGTGTKEELEGVDLTGKLALIQRGGLTFSEKIANATAHGAEGVIIFNNDPDGSNVSMAIDDTAIAIPSAFIPYKFGIELAKGGYQIKFSDVAEKFDNPGAGKFSSFSSWGLTTDGALKPDVAAPGGSIYSSFNNSKYGTMSGTSMASPHVAGVIALVKQYLKENFPEKSDEEVGYLVKALIMSNAKAHYNKEAQAYTSPRQQGAGLVDTASAVSTGLYVTGDDGYGSVTLGNVGDTFSFDVTIHNIGDKDKTLTYETNLETDEVQDGSITLNPRLLSTTKGHVLTVKANSSETITITVDASQFAELLTKEMPNGYYLEGFVRFLDPTDLAEVVSIPYVGFRGDFQNLAVVEKPVYNLVADGKEGVYFELNDDNIVESGETVTSLLTNTKGSSYYHVLGTYANDEGDFVLKLDENGQPHLAISPDGDGNQDYVVFKGVFLRNFANATAAVYAADDVNLEHPLWESTSTDGIKTYSGKASVLYATEWAGKDKDGKDLADGNYKYVLTYYPDVVGADPQHLAFDVIVDRKEPIITTATYDKDTFTFKPRKVLDPDGSGVFKDSIFYYTKDEKGKDKQVFLAQNPDGSFTLPLDLADIEDFYYAVEDYAGNVASATVKDLINVGNENGLVNVRLLDEQTNKVASKVDYTFIIKDAKGNVVTDIRPYGGDLTTLALPFGDYTVELALYDKEWGESVGPSSKTLTLSDDDSYKVVDFFVHTFSKAALVLDFDKTLPKGTEVAIVNKDGKVTVVPAARYLKTSYGKDVYTGDYTLSLNLPEGYEIYEEPDFTVISGKQNRVKFSVIDKTALTSETKATADLEKEARYYNASLAKLLAYRDALTSAQTILAEKHTQAEVDDALAKLQAAEAALDGQETQYQELSDESDRYADVQADPAYYNASAASRITYDTLYRSAKFILAKAQTTQEEVDTALADLIAAREALDGQATDFTALRDLSAKSAVLKVTAAKYQNASETVKDAYDQALEEALAVLANEGATQGEVDAALANLKAAEAELDGKEKQTTSTQTELNDFIPKEVIKSETPPKVEPQVSENEKGGEVAALGVVTVHKEVKVSTPAKPLASSKATDELPQTSSVTQNYLLALGFALVTLTAGIWKRRKVSKD
ncbi:cell envelope proteinase A (LPXTG motif) [Streptococcus equinus JB1]|uniref:Cell envelope proteinase A (LPXTG motif) n=2 Tax=Streptococcus equinus TaxID=1335 RepID=A0A091BP96_STREI|nr:S8 family serine peptidase [Streptococcus equinus]KFN87496.1 cell envelope proteinase A (LPXTG motif) [Streptococcus equinus JB1]SFL12787.1 lactocepin [Streptococcus equinus JB1]